MTADIPAVPESIPVTDALTLIAIDERYVSDLHQLVVKTSAGYSSRSVGPPRCAAKTRPAVMCRAT